MDLTDTPLVEALELLKSALRDLDKQDDRLTALIADPDNCQGCYAGEKYTIGDKRYIHRSWHSWSTLAHQLGCRMLTPIKQDNGKVKITFQSLDHTQSFHSSQSYDTDSIFGKIDKVEEPSFLYYYTLALDEVNITSRDSILDLGISKGGEIKIIEQTYGYLPHTTGIDIDGTALKSAQKVLPNAKLYQCDINNIESLRLGQYDLIISIATLQSPDINTKTTIMNLVQNHLTKNGALILAWPNSRWIDGEMIYGAKAPNYNFSEMSLVIKDIYWVKKYLQQHKFRVRIFGQEYLFVVATKIGLS